MVQGAPVVRRGRGFWVAGSLALLLPCMSWANRMETGFLNRAVFHAPSDAVSGWWLYVAVRVALAAWLVWTIFRFPRQAAPVARPRPTVGQPDARRWFDPLLGLRALACLMVLMGHFFMTVFMYTPSSRGRLLAPLLHSCPWAGVWVFFTLSGYLMGKGFSARRYSLDEAGSRRFLWNRFLRIGPVYYSAIVLVSIFRYPALLQWHNWWMLLEMFLFDFRGDLPVSAIGALWSVSTEVQFYMLVPLLMVPLLWLAQRLGRAFWVFPLLALGAGTLGRAVLHAHTSQMGVYGYAPMLPNLDIFVAGMSINLLPRWRSMPGWAVRRRGPILLVGAGLLYAGFSLLYPARALFYMPTLDDFFVGGPAVAVVGTASFIYFAEAAGKLEIRRGSVGLFLLAVQWMGTLTYCLYVFHSDVFESTASLLPAVHSLRLSLQQFPLTMLETLAVAAFFYFLVEKPFERRRDVAL